ncbi:hypothetical protein CORC01_13529 [Colletotrichum orchidophilum]|uniref:Uncharacterized protein n=1 Tax=Colletotrichum orchidophilum TaxID=1209926 RepID=A0A1G4APU2_9PEZI|nr:uncharacterized protein CORC01_13529 [Colletotrichum orchidophilum]OHE91187.1 hypothetical protein CORC01_13529 [Colletotrichum orchidophilum]
MRSRAHSTSTSTQQKAPARACLSRVVGRVPDIAQWSLLTKSRLRVGKRHLFETKAEEHAYWDRPPSNYSQIDNCIVVLGLFPPLPSWPVHPPQKAKAKRTP